MLLFASTSWEAQGLQPAEVCRESYRERCPLSFPSPALDSSVSSPTPLPSPSRLVHRVSGAGSVSHCVEHLEQKVVLISAVGMNMTPPIPQAGGGKAGASS